MAQLRGSGKEGTFGREPAGRNLPRNLPESETSTTHKTKQIAGLFFFAFSLRPSPLVLLRDLRG
jgi:hypothetical protein